MKHKIISLVTAALLALMPLAGALAEGTLAEFYDAGTALLFETDNVTLTGHAEFSLNGVRFKTADGTCVQAGRNSLVRLSLLTPRSDGTDRQTGYTVIANGNQVSIMEDYTPGYYRSTMGNYNSTSLITPTVYLNSVMALARAALDPLELSLEDCLAVTSREDGGRSLEIRLGKGDSPALLDGTVTLLGEYLAEAYLGISYQDYEVMDTVREGGYILEDWSSLFESIYLKKYGEALPEDYFESLWGEDREDDQQQALMRERYDEVSREIDLLVNDAANRAGSGMIFIRADGTEEFYESEDAYIVAKDMQFTEYENYMETARRRWEKETGESLTAEEFADALYGEYTEKSESVSEMVRAMDDEYLQMARDDGRASAVLVREDGTAEMIYNLQEWQSGNRIYNYPTVTEGIVFTLRSLAVDTAEIRAETDSRGRLTSVGGNLGMILTSDDGRTHALDVTFGFEAGAWGESAVDLFDPAAYGVELLPEE